MWPQRYDGCRSSRQPCGLSLFKAAPCPSVGLLSLCAYFWFSCLLAVITVADVPVLRETHSNHNPWAQGKPKGKFLSTVGWGGMSCAPRCPAPQAECPSKTQLHYTASLGQRGISSSLLWAVPIRYNPSSEECFWLGGEFSEICVWVSATWLLLTLMGVTQLETPVLPLGLGSPLMRVDCATHQLEGKSAPLPCLVKKQPGPLSTLTPTPLALCVYGWATMGTHFYGKLAGFIL